MARVQICNRGLSAYLGASRINSFEEDTPEARQCALHYEDTRDGLLARHWWNFATARVALAELTNDRSGEWLYKYARPEGIAAIRWVNEPEAARILKAMNLPADTERETTGDAIYSDVPGAVCEYTMLIDDDAAFPIEFRDALSASLAATIALPITHDLRLARAAQQTAQEMLDLAIATDDRNTPPDEAALPSWMRDRGVS